MLISNIMKEMDTEQQRAAITERLVQIWELGWSTLPEPVLALKREWEDVQEPGPGEDA